MEKTFFKPSTKTQIKDKNLVEVVRITDVSRLPPESFIILPETIVPKGFESARKFMKHGPEVKPKRYHTLDEALRDGRTPVQLREQAFDNLDLGVSYCGYTFMPIGTDRRKRKISLIECLEGARLFAYAHQMKGTGIDVKPYDNSKRVRIDGAEVVCNVPSRTKGEPRSKLKLMSVPIVDSPEKHKISLNLGSDHSCGSKRFNIRYTYTDDKEGSGIVNLCAHEIAANLEVIQHYMDSKNLTPLQMSQIAIPTQEMVDYYLKWENNVLIRDSNLKSKDKLRLPNRAEKEIALWEMVRELGHDRTFYSRASRDGSVAEYNWQP